VIGRAVLLDGDSAWGDWTRADDANT